MSSKKKDWVRIAFFVLSPVIGILGTAAYALAFGVSWWQPALFLILYAAIGVSVTAGYHRLFARPRPVMASALRRRCGRGWAMTRQN